MLFERFYEDGLAQASYLIGCQDTREAIVVDANRDIAPYLAAAARERLRITHVTETHIHADYVSGSRDLARAAGASLLLSGEGGTDWQYAFAASDRATLLRDGDVFDLGRVRVEVMHVPGHTPEHLAFLVTDLATSEQPVGVISGDCLFVGDVGRPDLLEKAAKVANTMDSAARDLFRSLDRFRRLPDFVQLWPGHGAGSACGKALGALPQSTIGYERVANWGLSATDEAAFVREVLVDQPDPPTYFARMKRVNRDGPPPLRAIPGLPTLTAGALRRADATGLLVDTRSAAAFGEGHVPGSLSLPFGKSFVSWAGWLVPDDRDLVLVADDAGIAEAAARALSLIGIDRVTGWLGPGALADWSRGGASLARIVVGEPGDVAARIAGGGVTVLDVRGDAEWAAGHVPGARHIPLGHLAARAGELPRSQPLVIHCQGGTRSAIGASLLQRHGFTDVTNMMGGFEAWTRAGLASTRG